MKRPTECHLCGRMLPLGGVLDDVGRPVHAFCKGLAKRDKVDAAQETARKIAKGHRPQQASARRLIEAAPVA